MLLETREDKWSVLVVAFEDVQSGLPVSIPVVKGKPTKVINLQFVKIADKQN